MNKIFLVEKVRNLVNIDNCRMTETEIDGGYGFFTNKEAAEEVVSGLNQKNKDEYEKYAKLQNHILERETKKFETRLREWETRKAALPEGKNPTTPKPRLSNSVQVWSFGTWLFNNQYCSYNVIEVEPAA